MKHEIVMPKAGLTNTEGVVGSWAFPEGTLVRKGDVIGDIENEKSTIPLTSPADGYLAGLAEPGTEHKVGAPIGYIADARAETAQAPAGAPEAQPAAAPEADPEAPAPMAPAQQGRKRVSPYARKLAARHGVDVFPLPGTGPGGSVVAADVLKAARQAPAQTAPAQAASPAPQAPRAVAAPAPIQGEYTDTPASAMRRAIARNLVESLHSTAQASAFAELDVTELLAFKDRLQGMEEELGNRIGLNEILSYLVARLAVRHPGLNARMTPEGMVRQFRDVNLSFALSTAKGLVTPVVRGAQAMNLNAFSKEMKRLVALGRGNALEADALEGGTVTISNLGMFPVDGFTPIVNPPQSAIFGFGRAVPKPVYEGEALVRREMMHVSAAFDHRLLDGADIGEVFRSLQAYLLKPELLFLA
ncbi:MAG TPA: dihydrolipoamide acetyltransferase family protein [Candidatus Limnocylindria bacterium]|nr:dihydrolipoamide acetyltransferase family protein [Candidatus Limnocylindria bacterium]